MTSCHSPFSTPSLRSPDEAHWPSGSGVAAASRTAVLLLHGLCSTPDELRPVRTALLALGYAVFAPRIEGYSFDPASQRQRCVPFASWIGHIERQIGILRATHDHLVLVGISAGSTLALAAAIRCGLEVDGLALLSTSLRVDGWAIPRSHALLPLALYTPLGRLWRYRERWPYGVKNDRVRSWIEDELRARRISSAGSAVLGVGHLRENDRLMRHVRRRLDRVRSRVLALHALEDEVASTANLDILARGLRHAPLRAVVLHDCYHMITIDNSRSQVIRETVDFVAGIARGAFPATPPN